MIKVFAESLYTKNRSLWDKVKHEIDYLLRVATAGSEEARKIEKAKKVFEKVYESKTKNPPVRVGIDILSRDMLRTGRESMNPISRKARPKRQKVSAFLNTVKRCGLKSPSLFVSKMKTECAM